MCRHVSDNSGFVNASLASEDSRSDGSNGGVEKLRRLKSRLKLKDLSRNELELKASLYFHICNPLKRWKVEKLVPYKLVLQIAKTILLITQVILTQVELAIAKTVLLITQVILTQVELAIVYNIYCETCN